VTFLWIIMSVIGYGWVLQKKNRKPWYLLIFLPLILTFVVGIIFHPEMDLFQVFGHILYEVNPSPFAASILLHFILLPVGWIILLSLSNKGDHYVLEIDGTRHVEKQPHRSRLLYNVFKHGKKLKWFISVCGIILVISSLSSFLLVKFGSFTYHFTPPGGWEEVPDFSFEYPTTYIKPLYFIEHDYLKPISYDVKAIYLEKALNDKDIENIAILYIDSSIAKDMLDVYTNYKDIAYAVTADKFKKPQTVPGAVQDLTISGLPAYGISSSVVYLPYNGGLFLFWQKSRYYDQIEATPDFIHLLETFKIHDE
jgi:hypothetical protein